MAENSNCSILDLEAGGDVRMPICNMAIVKVVYCPTSSDTRVEILFQ